MKKYLLMISAMLFAAAPFAQADYQHQYRNDSRPKLGGLPAKASSAQDTDNNVFFQKDRDASFQIAQGPTDKPGKAVNARTKKVGSDLDLRYVGWDKVKAGSKGNNGNGKNGNNGQKEENGEDEVEEKKGEENKEEDKAGGGWDRMWDAAKLG